MPPPLDGGLPGLQIHLRKPSTSKLNLESVQLTEQRIDRGPWGHRPTAGELQDAHDERPILLYSLIRLAACAS